MAMTKILTFVIVHNLYLTKFPKHLPLSDFYSEFHFSPDLQAVQLTNNTLVQENFETSRILI